MESKVVLSWEILAYCYFLGIFMFISPIFEKNNYILGYVAIEFTKDNELPMRNLLPKVTLANIYINKRYLDARHD